MMATRCFEGSEKRGCTRSRPQGAERTSAARRPTLISLGAIDFGIIINSTVIVIENIYRHLASGEITRENIVMRILRASHEVGRPILFFTVVFLIAFLPLFT